MGFFLAQIGKTDLGKFPIRLYEFNWAITCFEGTTPSPPSRPFAPDVDHDDAIDELIGTWGYTSSAEVLIYQRFLTKIFSQLIRSMPHTYLLGLKFVLKVWSEIRRNLA